MNSTQPAKSANRESSRWNRIAKQFDAELAMPPDQTQVWLDLGQVGIDLQLGHCTDLRWFVVCNRALVGVQTTVSEVARSDALEKTSAYLFSWPSSGPMQVPLASGLTARRRGPEAALHNELRRRVFVSGSVDPVVSPQLRFQLPEGLRSAPD